MPLSNLYVLIILKLKVLEVLYKKTLQSVFVQVFFMVINNLTTTNSDTENTFKMLNDLQVEG